MTAYNQLTWLLTPSGNLPAPPGSLGMIMGTTTLVTSSATIAVPFGGTVLVAGFCQVEGTALSTDTASVAVINRTITTATDATNYVTIKGMTTTDGVVNYQLVGHMDLADASV